MSDSRLIIILLCGLCLVVLWLSPIDEKAEKLLTMLFSGMIGYMSQPHNRQGFKAEQIETLNVTTNSTQEPQAGDTQELE